MSNWITLKYKLEKSKKSLPESLKKLNKLWFNNCKYLLFKLDDRIGIQFSFHNVPTEVMKFEVSEIKDLIKSLNKLIKNETS
jgi:DUF438 domain-containing protein